MTYTFPAASAIVPVRAEIDWTSRRDTVSPDATVYVQVKVVEAVTAGQVAAVSMAPVSSRSDDVPVVVTGSEKVTVIVTVSPNFFVPEAAVVIVETVGGVVSAHDPPDVATVAVDTTGEAVAVVGRLSFASAPVAPELVSLRVSVLPVAAMVTLPAFDVAKSAVPEEEMAGSAMAPMILVRRRSIDSVEAQLITCVLPLPVTENTPESALAVIGRLPTTTFASGVFVFVAELPKSSHESL